jgi:para-aminobenzoate synthetase component 1
VLTSDRVAAALVRQIPPEIDAAVWRSDASTVVGVDTSAIVVSDGVEGLRALDTLDRGTWVGWCGFELGHAIETVRPVAASTEPRAVPDVVFARFAAHAVVHTDGAVAVHGSGVGRALLTRGARAVVDGVGDDPAGTVAPGGWHSSLDRAAFEGRVEAILELLRAGECYQVNLTRRLTSDRPLDAAGLFDRIARTHQAPHLGFLRVRLPGTGAVAVVAASPERYLRVDGRSVETRPIKGTAADAAVLRASVKDHAENVMIVDLARNDLGRVCEPGSIHVPSLCEVEPHPGLHHLVSTVRGTRRADVGLGALVTATFPPASVTGAPKPRVLQAIEELEPVRRGVYCGGFGWIDTERDAADLAVAIRTFTVLPERAELGVGAGIVADSVPAAEWDETELKAARLLRAAGADVLVPQR